jgi:hypothetical protein
MERFIRDFGLTLCVLLLPPGLYCLHLGGETATASAPFFLIIGAALFSATLFGLFWAIRKHLAMREHERYLRGERPKDRS